MFMVHVLVCLVRLVCGRQHQRYVQGAVGVWAACSTSAKALQRLSGRRVWSLPWLLGSLTPTDITVAPLPSVPHALSVGSPHARRWHVHSTLLANGVDSRSSSGLFGEALEAALAGASVFYAPSWHEGLVFPSFQASAGQ